MQTNTSEFTNLTAFARAVAEHMKDSLGGRATDRRLLRLDEAADYCGLTRDSFKKKVVRDRLRRVRLDKCWRFDIADLDEWIDSHREADRPGGGGMSQKRVTRRTKGQCGRFRGKRPSNWQMSYWNGWRQVRGTIWRKSRGTDLRMTALPMETVQCQKGITVPTGYQAPAALLHISRLDASQIRVRCATRPALIALRQLQYMGNRQWQDQQQIHQTTTAWCS